MQASGEKTASVAIAGQAGKLHGVNINTDGTNDATVILYDDPDSADSKKLWEQVVKGADFTGGFLLSLPGGIPYNTGLYVSIAGTGASANVYFTSG